VHWLEQELPEKILQVIHSESAQFLCCSETMKLLIYYDSLMNIYNIFPLTNFMLFTVLVLPADCFMPSIKTAVDTDNFPYCKH
jgi:hypothetical protein